MRKRDYLVRILLIIMIVMSVILTLNISLNVGDNDSPVSDISPHTENGRSVHELLLPTSYFVHHKKRIYEIPKESELLKITDQLKETRLTEKNAIKSISMDDIKKIREYNEGTEFYYAGGLTLRDFNDAFSLQIDTILPDFKFNWIFINLSDNEMVFVNVKHHQVYSLSIHDPKVIKEGLPKDYGMEMISIHGEHLNYLPKYQHDLPVYRYLLSMQPYNNFTQALFTNPNSIETKEDGTHSLFKGNQDEELRINSITGVAALSMSMDQSMKGDSSLHMASDIVSRLGNEFGKLRYYTSDGDKTTFNVFVEGYPIFSEYYKGKVEVEVNKPRIKVFTNQESIHIPIASYHTQKVESGQMLIRQLKRKNIRFSRIQNIQLGYEWETSSDKKTVSLVPKWYIQYDHHFIPVNQLLKGEES